MRHITQFALSSLLLIVLVCASSTPTYATTLFLDDFNGSGDLHTYNNDYVHLDENPGSGTMDVVTDHLETNGFDPGYVYTGLTGDNKCASIDFNWSNTPADNGWTDILLDSTPEVSGSRFRITLSADENGLFHEWLFVSDNALIGSGRISLDRTQTHTMKACLSGSTVSGYLDDTLLFTEEGTIDGGKYLGFQGQQQITSLDQFKIEDAPPLPQLTALGPAKVYVSRQLPTFRLDLKAEVLKGSTLVSSGQLNSVAPSFLGATLESIPFSTFSPVDFPAGSTLKVVVSARNACTGSILNFGNATLYYNNTPVDSRFDATIDSLASTYHLRNAAALSTTAGTSQSTSVIAAGAICSVFKPFGTWSITL